MIKDYNGVTDIPLTEEEQEDFNFACMMLKNKIVACGCAQEAADALTFTLSRHTLTIPDGVRGAFHIHANGRPLYALRVTTAGTWFDEGFGASIPLAQASPDNQAKMLVFEIGMNLMPNMGHYLSTVYPQLFDKSCAGGAGGPAGMFDIETTFQMVDITRYMMILTEALGQRLATLMPPQSASTAKAKPQRPSGPQQV